MRFKGFLLLTGLALIVGPAVSLGHSRDKPGAGLLDLNAHWHHLAGEAAIWRRADITDPHRQFVFDLVAEKVQSTDGTITKEQFLGMPQRAAKGRPGEATARNPGAAGEPKAADVPTLQPPDPTPVSPPDGPREPDPGAEAVFRQMDTNGDGLLNNDEMDDDLRAERDKWDTNKDSFIDLSEFKEYYKARKDPVRVAHTERLLAALRQRGVIEEKRPAQSAKSAKGLFAPELPEGLPPWFQQYDTDGDGQIGLYEWKAAGQPIAKFLEMDANADGFLTPDEVLSASGVKAAPQEQAQLEQSRRMIEAAGLQDIQAISLDNARILQGATIQLRNESRLMRLRAR